MQGLVSIWGILTPAKRLMMVASVAATIVAFAMLARTASTPNMSLLYAGLDGRTASDVIGALERMDVPFEIRGEAIYVPVSKRDAARMSLAGEGLPQQGQAGYELLDTLNGFATTSDMFDATYWRAKEGELARTILSTPGIRAARVHIASQSSNAFSRNRVKPTAVVTVTMSQGRLEGANAQAIRYMVASAVPSLAPEQVAVLDSIGGVILSPGSDESMATEVADSADREQKLENDILNLLEARVGAGNARVQVALEIDMEREAITERVFDPNGRVIAGKETRETSETSFGGSSGAITVASNLPSGDAAPAGEQSRTERSETNEKIDFDMSEIRREREKLPGATRRLSVAVFVNQIVEEAIEEGGEPVLRTSEEIETLRELVANAAGYNEERGDTITIQTLPFKPISNDGVLVEADLVGDFIERHLMQTIQIAILSIVTLVLGLFVVKPLLSTKAVPQQTQFAAIDTETPNPQLTSAASTPAAPPDAITTLQEIANTKTDETANLIKSWLETAEDAA